MVKKIICSCVMLLFSVFSCDFLLLTPFPGDLTCMENHMDLSDYIEFVSDTYKCNLVVLDNLLCLEIEFNDNSQWLYLLDPETLEYMTVQTGIFKNLYMQDANGNYLLGNREFDGGLVNVEEQTRVAADHFGFSFQDTNYVVWMDYTDESSRELNIRMFDPDWSGLTSYEIGMPPDYELDRVVLDNTGDSPDSVYAVLMFRRDNSRLEAVMLPLDNLDTHPGGYPFGVPIIYFPNVDWRDCYYTHNGIVVRGRDDLYFYNFNLELPVEMLEGSRNENEWVTAFDVTGNFYYRYNIESRLIYKYLVWW